MCRVLLHYFGVVQAQRTYTNHTSPEITVCRNHPEGVLKHPTHSALSVVVCFL